MPKNINRSVILISVVSTIITLIISHVVISIVILSRRFLHLSLNTLFCLFHLSILSMHLCYQCSFHLPILFLVLCLSQPHFVVFYFLSLVQFILSFHLNILLFFSISELSYIVGFV